MGFDISSLTGVVSNLDVEYGPNFKVSLTFKPNTVTPEFMKESIGGERTLPDFLIYSLETILVDWDLTSGDAAFPPVKDNLSKLPTGFLDTVYGKIMENLRPNVPKRSSSFGDG